MKILLISIDNSSYHHYFPIGIAYLASVLRNNGHKITIYSQDVHHYPEEHLTRFLDGHNFDIVGIGTVSGYYPYKKLLKISEAINKSINRQNFKYVIGGHMVSADPDFFLTKFGANMIVKGEGEKSIIKICDEMKDGIYESPLIENLDELPFPAYNLFPIIYYRLQRLPNIEPIEFSMSIISGRGCQYGCVFCYRMYEGMRLRNIDNIIEEIKLLQINYNVSYIDFADNLTMSSKQRAFELSEALMPLNIKWRCEGRLNYVDEEVLTIMKKSGCVFINYGIEALDDEVLKNIQKALMVSQIYDGINLTKKVGISAGLNIMWGNKGDTIESLEKAVNFLKKYDDGSQIRTISPVTPFPGCKLYYDAIKEGKLKGIEDFYEHKHINSDLLTVNFTNVDDKTFHKALFVANKKLLWNYYYKKYKSSTNQIYNLYINKDISFRGHRHT